jgi:hypothetical protein
VKEILSKLIFKKIFLYGILTSFFISSIYANECNIKTAELLKIPDEAGFAAEYSKEGVAVWNYTTGRGSDHIYNAFSKFNKYIDKEREGIFKKKGLSLLDEQELINNDNMSVLSLGEGGAMFIYDLLKNRENIGASTKNIFAVDVVYRKRGKLSYLNSSREVDSTKTKERISSFLSEYPRKYLSKDINNLKILAGSGEKQLFDEIISSNGLNYVLDASFPDQRRFIIENLLSHLKKGGYIRSTPRFNDSIIDTILNQLVDEGVITMYRTNIQDQIIIKKLI